MSKRPLFIISPAEVTSMLASVSGRSATALRSRALLLTLQRCGLRVGEATRLRESDVNLVDGTLRITGSKRYRSRLIGLEPETAAHVAAWIDRRASLGIQAAPLFASLSGQSINANAIRAWLRRLAAKANISQRIVPHSLRHAFACKLAKSGARVDEVQSALGHTSLRTTAIYLSGLGAGSALDAVRRVSW